MRYRHESNTPGAASTGSGVCFHLQAPIIWIGLGWIASGLFIAPAIAGGREAKGQGFLVDLLFWVSLFVVAALSPAITSASRA